MKAPYKNALKSREKIRNSLIQIITSNTNLTDISVTDVIKLAHINRGTFYNHYKNVTEVFEEMKNELIEALAEGVKYSVEMKDIDGYIKALVVHFKENEDIYRQLVKVIPRSVIDDIKFKFINHIETILPNIDKINLYFLINGGAGLYFDYLVGKLDKPLEELGKDIINFIKLIIM